jgi:hypothetical protein
VITKRKTYESDENAVQVGGFADFPQIFNYFAQSRTSEKQTDILIVNDLITDKDDLFTLFLDADQHPNPKNFIEELGRRFNFYYFHSQSSSAEREKYCIVFPVKVKQDALDCWLNMKPRNLLKYFKDKSMFDDWDAVIDANTFKIRQSRFAYKSGYDNQLYYANGGNIFHFLPPEEDDLIPKTYSYNKQNRLLSEDECVCNIENIVKQKGNQLVFLLSPLTEVVPPERVIKLAEKVMTTEYKSEEPEKHLHTLDKYLYNIEAKFPIKELHFDRFISEKIDEFDLNGNFVVDSPTGTGKSKLVADLCAKFGLKPLVVTPRKELRNQWINDYGVDSVCYQQFKSKIPTESYDVIIFDEYHKLYEFYDTHDYKHFVDYWLNFKGVKIALSATPDFEVLQELYPEYNFKYYYGYKSTVKKLDIVKLICESDDREIQKYVIDRCKSQDAEIRNWIIYFSRKEQLLHWGKKLRETTDYNIFEYYTDNTNDRNNEKIENKFKAYKKKFETQQRQIILTTVKMDVGIDIQPEHKVGVVAIDCRDEMTLTQFCNRCRKNIVEVIIQENLVTESQKYFFQHYWKDLFDGLLPTVSLSEFYVSKKDKDGKYKGDCYQLCNQENNAKINIPVAFLKLANLNRTMRFDACFNSIKEYNRLLGKMRNSYAFKLDGDLRRMKVRDWKGVSDDETKAFYGWSEEDEARELDRKNKLIDLKNHQLGFRLLDIPYRWCEEEQRFVWVKWKNYDEFIEGLEKMKIKAQTTDRKTTNLKVWKLIHKLDPFVQITELIKYDLFGIEYKEGQIVIPEKLSEYDKVGSDWELVFKEEWAILEWNSKHKKHKEHNYSKDIEGQTVILTKQQIIDKYGVNTANISQWLKRNNWNKVA